MTHGSYSKISGRESPLVLFIYIFFLDRASKEQEWNLSWWSSMIKVAWVLRRREVLPHVNKTLLSLPPTARASLKAQGLLKAYPLPPPPDHHHHRYHTYCLYLPYTESELVTWVLAKNYFGIYSTVCFCLSIYLSIYYIVCIYPSIFPT